MSERIEIEIGGHGGPEHHGDSGKRIEHALRDIAHRLERNEKLLGQILAKLPVYYPKTSSGSIAVE